MIPLVTTYFAYFPDHSPCGYCKGAKDDPSALPGGIPNEPTPVVPHMVASQALHTSCEHYDKMMQLGFRRSGTLMYRMDLLRGCCRLYTIRTKKEFLSLDKKMRKAVNRFVKELGYVPPKLKNNQKYDPNVLLEAEHNSSRFYTRFEPNSYSDEKYDLFRRYQKEIHKEDTTERSFSRFLCEDPFSSTDREGTPQQWAQLNSWIKTWGTDEFDLDPRHRRMGPTHECYYLDGKLIAFSVLDFLPSGVSSVYFVWDPDYAHLSLGNISGIRELLMCTELGLGYYYLGYYASDCPKLRYKANYGGELLDICNGVFVPIDRVRQHLKDGKLFVLGQQEQVEADRPECALDFAGSGLDPTINVATTMFAGLHDPSSPLRMEARKFKEMVEEVLDVNLDTSVLPDVFPGAMSYRQLFSYVDKGTLSASTVVKLYTTRHIIRPLGECNNEEKVAYLDAVRVLGVDLCESLLSIPSFM